MATSAGVQTTTVANFEGAIAFDWAPKGDYIAYVESPQSINSFLGNLIFVDLSDPDAPVFIETEAENVIAFFWSPDGSQVVYFVPAILDGAENSQPVGITEPAISLVLNIADATDGSVRQLTSILPSNNFLNILPFFDQYQRSSTIWSPDGNYLVVSALPTEDGTPGIFIIPSAGSLPPRFLVEGTLAQFKNTNSFG